MSTFSNESMRRIVCRWEAFCLSVRDCGSKRPLGNGEAPYWGYCYSFVHCDSIWVWIPLSPSPLLWWQVFYAFAVSTGLLVRSGTVGPTFGRIRRWVAPSYQRTQMVSKSRLTIFLRKTWPIVPIQDKVMEKGLEIRAYVSESMQSRKENIVRMLVKRVKR